MFGVRFAAVFGARGVVGMGGVFFGVLLAGTLVMRVLFTSFCRAVRRNGGGLDPSRIGQGYRRQRLVRMRVGVLVMFMIVFVVSMFMIMPMFVMLLIMMLCIGMMMLGVMGVTVIAFGVVLRVPG